MLREARDFVGRFPRLHHAIRSFWTPPKSIYRHLSFSGMISVEVVPGVSFKLDCHGEYVENELFWKGFGTGWEGKSLKLWSELARSAQWVIDIGANTGVYSLATKAVQPSATVMAIEPSKRVFGKLTKNIELNGFSIIAIEAAASDSAGVVTFYDIPDAHQYIGSLEANSNLSIATTVPAETVDDLLSLHQFGGLDLVKIDVERHEPSVLRGMRGALQRWQPTMIIEVLDGEVERGVRSALEGLGYELQPIGSQGSPDPVADARNFLAAPSNATERLSALLTQLSQ